jgi:hypothetical protein
MPPEPDAELARRITQLEVRADKLENSIDAKLALIFDKLNALTLDTVRNACPSPGACVGLGKELEHAITAHNATMLRVERLELKIMEVDRRALEGFHKLETQKAWVLGAWSVIAFCAAIIGALATILVNYYLRK